VITRDQKAEFIRDLLILFEKHQLAIGIDWPGEFVSIETLNSQSRPPFRRLDNLIEDLRDNPSTEGD
jgi:hypothetical protein